MAHAREVDLVEITRMSGVFPDDGDDVPLVLRDVPCIVVDPPWDDLEEALGGEMRCDDIQFTMVSNSERAVLTVGLYEPYVTFQVTLPLPLYVAEIAEMLRMGYVSMATPASSRVLLIPVG